MTKCSLYKKPTCLQNPLFDKAHKKMNKAFVHPKNVCRNCQKYPKPTDQEKTSRAADHIFLFEFFPTPEFNKSLMEIIPTPK